jgi:hypothetical protein
VVGRDDAAHARHVVDDDRRVAGNVLGEMAGDKARVLIVTAAGRKSDHDAHRLALIKTGHGLFIKGSRFGALSRPGRGGK